MTSLSRTDPNCPPLGDGSWRRCCSGQQLAAAVISTNPFIHHRCNTYPLSLPVLRLDTKTATHPDSCEQSATHNPTGTTSSRNHPPCPQQRKAT